MKKSTLVIIATLLLQLSYGQVVIKRDTIYPPEEDKKEVVESKQESYPRVETLFQNQKSFGGYLGISMGYTQIDGEEAFTVGGRTMFVANHYIGIGFGGKGFMTMPRSDSLHTYNGDNYYGSKTYIANAGGYGGIYIEPVVLSLKPIHVSLPVLLGAGGIVNEIWTDGSDPSTTSSSAFFICEPGLDVEFNIATWFRIGVGASYRFTSKIEGLAEASPYLLEGANYGITFKFGWF
ncbi:MAG: hypothetical protein PF517_16930 [Salinivirgaceae bacterium]|jgi:hypothetical protein|nr:hypothetical protein [Salinivirgaceae bacterium]